MTETSSRRTVRAALLAATVMLAAAIAFGEARRASSAEAPGAACVVPVDADGR
jgi:hypothetical protein